LYSEQKRGAMLKPSTQTRVPALALSTNGRFAVLLIGALLWAFGGAACGVQEGQEKVDKAREVEKQMEERQQHLEKKLQEGDQKLEEGQ
jgi:hypothetical protein